MVAWGASTGVALAWPMPGAAAVPPLTLTVLKVTVADPVKLCAVTATPPRRAPVMPAKARVEPGIRLQVTPSVEVEALKDVPARATFRYVGTAPASETWMTAATPAGERYCTERPLPGVTTAS
jgi:hypothetical protein